MKQATARADGALEEIPGVGPCIARDLRRIGIQTVRDLRGKSPERLYAQLARAAGECIDPCVLYVFRCAVYYASRRTHDPRLLKWWNWKNRARA